MNKPLSNRRLFYYPAVFYTALLLLVWLLSWAVGIAGLALGYDASMNSLVSAEGLRWAVRSAQGTIDSAPWGVIMLFVCSLGLLTGSGMVKSARKFLKGGALAINERRAWLFALIAAAVYLLLLFVCTLPPWNLLLGVTGDLYASPLVQGRVIICFIGLFIVAASFGFIYGNYRSLIDIARSLGTAFSLYAPALLAVLPATGIMPCVEFAGFLPLLHIDAVDVAVVSDIIYLLPFLYVMAVLRAQQRNME